MTSLSERLFWMDVWAPEPSIEPPRERWECEDKEEEDDDV